MSDTINSLDALNKLFQNLLISMLGYVKEGSPAAYPRAAFEAVRVSWPTTGAPAWKITDNVVFIRTTEEDDPINIQREDRYYDVGSPVVLNHDTSYTRVIALGLISYGPSSWNNMRIIRDKMFNQEFRDVLALSNVFLIPDAYTPRRLPELFGGNWWERVDMDLAFNEKVIINREVPYIESAEIVVVNGDGVQATITN